MSRASIEQALTGLIPAISGPIPPELIEIALSLLARSRSVAQSLKPDEEIARPYACAQLACERYDIYLQLMLIALTSTERNNASIFLPSYHDHHVRLAYTRSYTTTLVAHFPPRIPHENLKRLAEEQLQVLCLLGTH